MSMLPEVAFSTQNHKVTRVGLGGEGVLRTFGREAEAREVILSALNQGITYFDTAPAYSGSQNYLGSVWKENPEARAGIFQTSKSAERSYDRAMLDLEQSLQTLGSESLDLWQIHDLRSMEEVHRLEAADGALQAFVRAQEEGLVRHIGVTGHHDPRVLELCVQNWPLDSVLLPCNPVETLLGGFLDTVAERARARDMAVIGMKCLGAGYYIQPRSGVTAEKLLKYALGSNVNLIIGGCSGPQEVKTLSQALREPAMTENERRQMESLFRPNMQKLGFYRGKL